MVQYPTLHYSTLTPSFLCGLWGDGYTYAFSNMLSGLFFVSLKALNTESWCRRVNFMNSPQSAIMCSQKSRWMNGTERNNGNMSHSFYFWQHWVTVLGQIPYYIKISSAQEGKCPVLWVIVPDTAISHLGASVKFKDDMRQLSWQTLPMLACWVSSEVARCCEAWLLSCGECWHDEGSKEMREKGKPGVSSKPPTQNWTQSWICIFESAFSRLERTSCGAVCNFLSVCVCVLCM